MPSPCDDPSATGELGPAITLGTVALRIDASGGRLTAALAGELDLLAADELLRIVVTRIDADEPRVLSVDLDALTFVDSSGLRVLLQLEAYATGRACAFRIDRPRPLVRRVIELSGLADHFGVADRGLGHPGE